MQGWWLTFMVQVGDGKSQNDLGCLPSKKGENPPDVFFTGGIHRSKLLAAMFAENDSSLSKARHKFLTVVWWPADKHVKILSEQLPTLLKPLTYMFLAPLNWAKIYFQTFLLFRVILLYP